MSRHKDRDTPSVSSLTCHVYYPPSVALSFPCPSLIISIIKGNTNRTRDKMGSDREDFTYDVSLLGIYCLGTKWMT